MIQKRICKTCRFYPENYNIKTNGTWCYRIEGKDVLLGITEKCFKWSLSEELLESFNKEVSHANVSKL